MLLCLEQKFEHIPDIRFLIPGIVTHGDLTSPKLDELNPSILRFIGKGIGVKGDEESLQTN